MGVPRNNSPGDDDFLGLIDEVRVSAGSNSDFSADWMVASDFSYTDVSGGGAASVNSMWTDTDGTDNVVTIAVNAAFNSDDFYTDLIAPASNQIYDLVDVAASTTAVAITTDISISSAANQTFIVGDPVTPAAIITIHRKRDDSHHHEEERPPHSHPGKLQHDLGYERHGCDHRRRRRGQSQDQAQEV